MSAARERFHLPAILSTSAGDTPTPGDAARDGRPLDACRSRPKPPGLLRAIWSAEEDPHRRRALAKAGHQILQALELAETNEAQAHSLVNLALNSVRDSMKYYAPLAPVFNAAVDRVRAKR